MSTAVHCALAAWAGTLAWMDWRQQRIPNTLLLLLLVPALLALAINGRGLLEVPPLHSLGGLLLAGGLLLPGYALGHMGAGDVKFSACLGLLLGWKPALEMLLVSLALLGAVCAFILWRAPGAGRRRIAAAPAFAAAFGAQLAGFTLL